MLGASGAVGLAAVEIGKALGARVIAWRGRFLVIGFTAGIPRIPLNLALLKGCSRWFALP